MSFFFLIMISAVDSQKILERKFCGGKTFDDALL
jgi:hypothetical protein